MKRTDVRVRVSSVSVRAVWTVAHGPVESVSFQKMRRNSLLQRRMHSAAKNFERQYSKHQTSLIQEIINHYLYGKLSETLEMSHKVLFKTIRVTVKLYLQFEKIFLLRLDFGSFGLRLHLCHWKTGASSAIALASETATATTKNRTPSFQHF